MSEHTIRSSFDLGEGHSSNKSDFSTNWGPALLCCWPGLPGLWYRGRWSSLVLAIGFSILLNLTVVASFIWTGIFQDEKFPAIAWPVLMLVWFCTTVLARRNLPDVMSLTKDDLSTRLHDDSDDAIDTLFIDARREYLKGHWKEARGLLTRQLRHHPRDIESRLMLATLFRHTRQFDDAVAQLNQIEKYDPAINWANEIARERELLRIVHEYEMTQEDPAANLGNNNDGFIREGDFADKAA
jgi:tetratricopeptide (TPR) repeat protein